MRFPHTSMCLGPEVSLNVLAQCGQVTLAVGGAEDGIGGSFDRSPPSARHFVTSLLAFIAARNCADSSFHFDFFAAAAAARSASAFSAFLPLAPFFRRRGSTGSLLLSAATPAARIADVSNALRLVLTFWQIVTCLCNRNWLLTPRMMQTAAA